MIIFWRKNQIEERDRLHLWKENLAHVAVNITIYYVLNVTSSEFNAD